MASNARFHNKYHRRNHHTLPSAGYPDSGADPIASPQEPFIGDFHAVGALSATGNLTIGGNTLIYGNLSALGDFSVVDTIVTVTSALSVINNGTGPAFTVRQTGAQPVAIFFDDGNKILNLKDGLRAEFFNSQATNNYALAEGYDSFASGRGSHAEGGATVAAGDFSHAEGDITRAIGYGSHAEGSSSIASGDYSHAEGSSTASGDFSHAEGETNNATGEASHAEGYGTIASGTASHAEGKYTIALGDNSHAEGFYSGVVGGFGGSNHAEGTASYTGLRCNFSTYVAATRTLTFTPSVSSKIDNYTSAAAGVSAILYITTPTRFTPVQIESRDPVTGSIVLTKDAVGSNVASSLRYLVLPGNNSLYAHAEGYRAEASGNTSHAEGQDCWADGIASHAEGSNTNALNDSSHAEGTSTTASGIGSHAEGAYNTASGYGSHAEGGSSAASGTYSHAEGAGCLASGDYSHAEGQGAIASGTASHAAGSFTRAIHDRTWIWKGDTVFDAISTTRTNQFLVSAAGGIFFPGNVGIGTDNNTNALTVNGSVSASNNVFFYSSTGRNLDLIHTPANDGTNPVLRIGECTPGSTTLSGFSGAFVSYDESTNVFGISSLFLPEMGIPAISITKNGNVGIGTNAPSRQLNVALPSGNTEVAITTDSSSVASLYFGYPSNDNRGQIRYYNSGDSMGINVATQEAVRIRGGGQVGIGVSLPAEKLTVLGNISASGNVLFYSSTGRNLDLFHTPANDGTNPVLRIGECTPGDTALSGFSGAFVSYDESTNVFGISSVFAPAMGIPAMSIDRNGNFFTSSNASSKMTIAYAMTSINYLAGVGAAGDTVYLPVFKVPANVLYFVPGVDITFTVENFAGGQTGGVTPDTMPIYRLNKNNAGINDMTVDIVPLQNSTSYNAVGWNRSSTNTQSNKAIAAAGDTVYLRVKTPYAQGSGTSPYTTLSGRIIMTGYYLLP